MSSEPGPKVISILFSIPTFNRFHVFSSIILASHLATLGLMDWRRN